MAIGKPIAIFCFAVFLSACFWCVHTCLSCANALAFAYINMSYTPCSTQRIAHKMLIFANNSLRFYILVSLAKVAISFLVAPLSKLTS